MATATPKIMTPSLETFAASTADKDPGKAYGQKLAVPEDSILTSKGGGRYNIYSEMLRDEQVKSCFQQQRLALIGRPWDIVPGEENSAAATAAAEELKANLLQLEWDRIADRMLYGVFYGFAVGEIMWKFEKGRWLFADVEIRDRGRFAWGMEKQLVLMSRGRPDGELMQTHFDIRAALTENAEENPAGGKFWAYNTGADHDDDPYGKGLAYSLYWHVFFKRQNVRFWLKFLEKFASPTPAAKAPAGKLDNPTDKTKILEVLASITNDAGVVIPDWLETFLIEAKRAGTVDYDALRNMADRAIAKIIIGQTMTSEQEGGQYKAEVAKDIRDEIIKANADLMANSFNRGPAAWWTHANYGPDVPPPRISWKVEQEEDKNARAERDNKIASLGYEPEDGYIEETYGPGWVKKAPAPIPPALATPPPPGPAFAEPMGRAAILDALSGHMGDQQRIKDAAVHMGREFREILGSRVDELMAYAEETGDLESFRRKLVELMAEQPAPATVERFQRQSFSARLAGLFRQNRG